MDDNETMLSEEEKQIQCLMENIEDRRIELKRLSRNEIPNKKTKRRLQIDELNKQINLDLYRIHIMQRKLTNERLSRLSLEKDTLPEPSSEMAKIKRKDHDGPSKKILKRKVNKE
jgi:hypothetical protein